jgi:hypothetical protein
MGRGRMEIEIKVFDVVIFALPAPSVAAIITTPPPNEMIIIDDDDDDNNNDDDDVNNRDGDNNNKSDGNKNKNKNDKNDKNDKNEIGSITMEVLQSISYAPHIRAYLSRVSNEQKQIGYHLVPVQSPLATIEWFSSDMGAWGSCPSGRQWMLLCATADATVEYFLNGDDDETIIQKLWSKAKQIVPDLFEIDSADVKHVVRWESAIPILSPSACIALNRYLPRLPVVFCGDWTYQPCIEGAVRSAIRATDIFPSFQSPHSSSSPPSSSPLSSSATLHTSRL